MNLNGLSIPGTGTPGTPGSTTPGSFQNPDGTPTTIAGGRESGLGGDVGTGQATFVPGTTTPGTPGTPDQSLQSLVNPNLAPGSLTAPWTQQFQAPTNVTEQNDPGYQFRLQQGQQLLENSAAARGDLLNGGTAKAEQQFGQDYASNEYGNVYNRALGQYQQNYNIYAQNQANQYNRLASLAGVGQTAANTLTGAGQQAANNAGNIMLQSGAAQAAGINNAAAARASGYVGGANAYSGALGSATNNLSQLALLNSIYGQGGGGGAGAYNPNPTNAFSAGFSQNPSDGYT